jgi:tetraacyldisaccharide 4'-kinase
VIAGQDRFKSAERAADFGLDIAILDDGFQHRRLDREMDILLIDTVSFPGNRYLLPAGVLREPVEALKRADLFVLTKIDAAGEKRKIEVQTMLKKYAPGVPVICARHKPVFLTDVTGAAYSIDDMHRRKILVISAIADPDYLRFLIEKNGGMIFGQSRYPDHYHYAQNDIQIISDMARQRDADMVITTKKDYVKLRELDISSIEAKLFVLNITIEIEEGKEKLIAGLDRFINP